MLSRDDLIEDFEHSPVSAHDLHKIYVEFQRSNPQTTLEIVAALARATPYLTMNQIKEVMDSDLREGIV